MVVVRKVESKIKIKQPPKEVEKAATKNNPVDADLVQVRTKKVCPFCENKIQPHYYDSNALRRFLNDRGRIVSRQRLGTCSKHQRRLTLEIKRARHLSLLPFTLRLN